MSKKKLEQEKGALLEELQKVRAQLALATQQLEKPSSATSALDAPTVVKRSHIHVAQSQEPDIEALVRLARRNDESISALRCGQFEVIKHLFSNRDCMALMPTGGGKSLIWLLHNLLSTEQRKEKSLTIVVVPFTATIDSRVAKTQRWGTVLSSQDSMELVAEKLSTASFLYTTPEKITHNASFAKLLSSQAHRVTLVVYDEAHEWLNSWRAGICECVQILHNMFPSCCRFACTATCRIGDSATLINNLSLEKDTKVERCSIDRKNCYLHVKAMTNETSDVQSIFKEFLKKSEIEHLPQVLLFVTSQDQAQRMEKLFKDQCQKSAESALTADMIVSYHAATPREQKQAILADFVAGRIKLIVCTSAFGTGVDVPNIAVIIHYTLPPSITVYLQNIGRGGRSGMRYDC
jgi:ATP-dependent DNA helicase RecQ